MHTEASTMHTAHATNTRCGRERCADKSGAAESGAAESSADESGADESGADESVRMSERPSGGRGPRCEDAVRAQMRWIARRASAWPAAAARHARARQPFARLPARPFRAPRSSHPAGLVMMASDGSVSTGGGLGRLGLDPRPRPARG